MPGLLTGSEKWLREEFDEIYALIWAEMPEPAENQEKSGSVFGDNIKVGVAISFMIKRKQRKNVCKIFYYRP